MSQSLFEISADLQALDDLLMELGGDVSDPKVAEAIAAWEKELTANLLVKVDNYAALIRTMELRADARNEEVERLGKLVDADKASAKFLKYRLKSVLEMKGLKKLDTARFRLSIAGNGGRFPMTIVDAKLLPSTFFVPQPDAIDHDAIYEKLNAGQDVPGAKLEPRGTHLRIK